MEIILLEQVFQQCLDHDMLVEQMYVENQLYHR
jgi:hypothetical protein